MYTRSQVGPSPSAELSFGRLHRLIEQVAAAGRLRISAARAVDLFHSAALGVVVTLLRSQPHARDLALASMARDNTLSMIAIVGHRPPEQAPLSVAAATIQAAVIPSFTGDGMSIALYTGLRAAGSLLANESSENF